MGRADMLRVDESALHSKSATLDLGPILTPAASLAPGEPQFNAQVRARVRVRVSPDPNPNPNPSPDPNPDPNPNPEQGFATPRDGAAGEASWGQDHFSKEATMLDELVRARVRVSHG